MPLFSHPLQQSTGFIDHGEDLGLIIALIGEIDEIKTVIGGDIFRSGVRDRIEVRDDGLLLIIGLIRLLRGGGEDLRFRGSFGRLAFGALLSAGGEGEQHGEGQQHGKQTFHSRHPFILRVR